METPFVILAIDTSLGPCSVAVGSNEAILAEEKEPTPGSQSRMLVPMIEAVLKQANLTYQKLGAVACTIGPGGFTGIRVGLATARAIVLATEKPLIGLSTLEVIAFGARVKGDVLAVIDAYRGQRYAQRFRMNGSLTPQSDALLIEEKALPALAHGAKTTQALPQARDAALLAAQKWAMGERNFPAAPLYIREPDAKPPAEGLKYAGELL